MGKSGRSLSGWHDAAPNLVLLHGAGGGAWEWRLWRRWFEAHGHASYCPDFSAEASRADCTLDALLERVATELPPSPRVLVGASFGGLLALLLAERFECAGLVLVNPALPEAAVSSTAGTDLKLWGRLARVGSTRAAMPDAHPLDVGLAFRSWRDFRLGLLREARLRVAGVVPAARCLLIASSEDADVPVALARRWAADQRAELIEVQGNHLGPLLGRGWLEAAEASRRWLRALAPS